MPAKKDSARIEATAQEIIRIGAEHGWTPLEDPPSHPSVAVQQHRRRLNMTVYLEADRPSAWEPELEDGEDYIPNYCIRMDLTDCIEADRRPGDSVGIVLVLLGPERVAMRLPVTLENLGAVLDLPLDALEHDLVGTLIRQNKQ